MSTIDEAISRVKGVVGVAVKHLETGREIGIRADETFFTASTLKVPLLVELYRQVDAGRIDLSRRVEFTKDLLVPGSGVLRYLGEGLRPTLQDLAMLMTIVSDNVATDVLYELVGRERLNESMLELGFTKTRIPMSTRELLFSIVGLDPNNPQHTFEEALRRRDEGHVDLEGDAYSEERSDVSAPAEMSRLLEMVYLGEVLSESSTEAALHILKSQKLNTVIPYYLPEGTVVAHKTGGVPGVRCDVGIVYGPTGPYTVALMAKGIEDRTDLDPSLAKVSRAVYDEFESG